MLRSACSALRLRHLLLLGHLSIDAVVAAYVAPAAVSIELIIGWVVGRALIACARQVDVVVELVVIGDVILLEALCRLLLPIVVL